MLELNASAAPGYIAQREGIPPDQVSVHELGGGVSNHVLLIETPNGKFVLKQSLGKLRVAEDWESDRERIFREACAMRLLEPLLPGGATPVVLFEDKTNFAFGMSAAAGTRNWKEDLLAGDCDPSVAAAIARIHVSLLLVSWESRLWKGEFGDIRVFDQLRLDPYYRSAARRHPEWQAAFESAIRRCQTQPRSLVHGDWSPKNMMVDGSHVTVIDWEVIHYGDPGFDVAFLLNHLLLKMFVHPEHVAAYRECALEYWNTLSAALPSQSRTLAEGAIEHLPLLLLARTDGKSPAEYLSQGGQQAVRDLARSFLTTPPGSLAELIDRGAACH